MSLFPNFPQNFAERQNAELAKMRQECAKLTKEVGEKTESLLATENIRKGLEAKVSAAEKQLSLLQVGPGLWGLITSLSKQTESWLAFLMDALFFPFLPVISTYLYFSHCSLVKLPIGLAQSANLVLSTLQASNGLSTQGLVLSLIAQ